MVKEQSAADKGKTNKPARPSQASQESGPGFESSLTGDQQTVLMLQRLVGNSATMRLMVAGVVGQGLSIQRWTLEQAREQVPNAPEWAGDEANVRQIQRQLRRLGYYNLRLDGDYGTGTDVGLVETFGGNDFRTMEAGAVLSRLQQAEPPEGTRGEHQLRYGELFSDGVLDMTLGLGYDENAEADPTALRDTFQSVLQARDFELNQSAAAEIYRQAGRTMQPSLVNMYFVKRDALVYRPPAGEARSIHAVIRFTSNPTGLFGGAAAQSFREGMVQSDVSFYAGHGRYGSGPDFDRNFASFVLTDLDDRSITHPPILDYHVLEQTLRDEVTRQHVRRSPFQQFLWRHENNLIEVTLRNEGNIRINTRNLHRGEFGADLINWSLETGRARPATGEGGSLAEGAAAHPERRYRVLVFDGCRTSDYERSIRATPGFDQSTTQTITTTRTVYPRDVAETLGSFLDSILQQQSAEQIVENMDARQETIQETSGSSRGTFRGQGTRYDPRTR